MIYKKKNRGYTLIELIIVIAIIMILSGATISIIVHSLHNYNNTVERSFQLVDLDNAMLNLDGLCNSTLILSLEANSEDYLSALVDNIVISYLDNYENENIKKKIVYLSDGKLRVKTISKEGSNFTTGYNILLSDASGFKVTKKDNLIYYKITTKWGGKRIRCI